MFRKRQGISEDYTYDHHDYQYDESISIIRSTASAGADTAALAAKKKLKGAKNRGLCWILLLTVIILVIFGNIRGSLHYWRPHSSDFDSITNSLDVHGPRNSAKSKTTTHTFNINKSESIIAVPATATDTATADNRRIGTDDVYSFAPLKKITGTRITAAATTTTALSPPGLSNTIDTIDTVGGVGVGVGSATKIKTSPNKKKNSNNTTHIPACLYNKKGTRNNGPTNIILMSIGRSGSTVIWQMLSTLTGYETRSHEYVGSDTSSINKFLNRTIPSSKKLSDGEWLINHICDLRRTKELQKAAFVGFKWKSFWVPFWLPESQKTFERIASMANFIAADTYAAVEHSPGPPIRVLRSRRNVLDVLLSRKKHKESSNVGSHCYSSSEPDQLKKCLKAHERGARNVTNVKKLHRDTLKLWDDENRIDDRLRSLGVPTESISYDTLFYPTNEEEGANEWYKALQYVSPTSSWGKHNKKMSLSKIYKAAKHISTSKARCHKDVILNWEEVYLTFKGTAIEHLFRLD